MWNQYNIKDTLSGVYPEGSSVVVKAWVKTKRVSKEVAFINLNDGSTINNLQVVLNVNEKVLAELARVTTGASVCVFGKIVRSEGQGQGLELFADNVEVLGESGEGYPIQPKKHSLEFLRSVSHLRVRTSTFGAVYRIRSAVVFAIHRYFQERNFVHVHSPLITTADGEGAGEMFGVTTLDVLKQHSDFSKDFFSVKACLTVTGQLEAETAIFGLGKVYTLGPTFRAENSNTTRHLAEFWMMEPEMAFCNLEDNMVLAIDMLKYVINYCLEFFYDDLIFLEKFKFENGINKDTRKLIEVLRGVVVSEFEVVTYTEAIEILQKAKENFDGTFVYKVERWGEDIKTEHERFLVEKYFKKPVVIKNYPKEIKAFYMKQNDDGKTVAAMDVLFPGIGEVIGGSQREESLEKLMCAVKHFGIDVGSLQWYLDTRRFGTVVHSGFGLGIERLVMFITGMENIRDVIPFPRTPGNASNGQWKV